MCLQTMMVMHQSRPEISQLERFTNVVQQFRPTQTKVIVSVLFFKID